jgi:two-component system sporulation sensor kinase B
MEQDIVQILFNNTLINIVVPPLLYYVSLTYVRKKPKKKAAVLASSAVAMIVCLNFPVTMWSDYRLDLRHIGMIFGSLYGGPAAAGLLFVVMSAYRIAIGGSSALYAIAAFLTLVAVLLLVRPAYLRSAPKRKLQLVFAVSAGYAVFLNVMLVPVHWWHSVEFCLVSVGATMLTFYVFIRAEHQSALESHLETSERLKAVSQIAASVSHEIRNPLTVVSGFIQLMMEQEMDREKQLQYFELILEELKRSQLIINDYLALAREQGESHDIRVDEELGYIRNIITPLATLHQVEVETDFRSSAQLRINRNTFRQSLLNVTKNGIEAMPNGGTLKLRSSAAEDKLVITIEDSGVGMTPEQLSKLGTPFFTDKSAGTGLGMLIVTNMLKQSGGKMKVTSEPGKGTAFVFEFPLVPAPRPPSPP